MTLSPQAPKHFPPEKHGYYGEQHWTRADRLWRYHNGEWCYLCPCGLPAISYPFKSESGFTVWTTEGTLFLRREVCFTDCSNRELVFKDRAAGDFRFQINRKVDQDGFTYCAFCGRIEGQQLVQCPDCKKFFKGPRRFFPVDYECVKCG